MEKQFIVRMDEIELDSIKEYAKQNNVSAAEVFRNGALLVISGVQSLDNSESIKELEELRKRITDLETENGCLRDTLESNSGAISHVTMTGREIPNYGLPTKSLNQALANVHYRLARIPAGSADHFCRLTNAWASAVLRITPSNFKPNAPSKEQVAEMEKEAKK